MLDTEEIHEKAGGLFHLVGLNGLGGLLPQAIQVLPRIEEAGLREGHDFVLGQQRIGVDLFQGGGHIFV